jgi:hypothetical protein
MFFISLHRVIHKCQLTGHLQINFDYIEGRIITLGNQNCIQIFGFYDRLPQLLGILLGNQGLIDTPKLILYISPS